MPYNGAEDPELRQDLLTALKGWHGKDLGTLPLVTRLASARRQLANDPDRSPEAVAQQVICAALDRLQSTRYIEDVAKARLLERRYVNGETIESLCAALVLGQRGLYYRLDQALHALAGALWDLEQEQEASPARRSDPVLDAQPAALAAERGLGPQLPAPTYTRLFGVDPLLAQLLDRLRDEEDHWLISVEGMGGLGKTALAREAVARLAAGSRFTRIAWVTAKQEFLTGRGLEQSGRPALTFEQLLDSIVDQLDDAGPRPWQAPAKREYLRSLLKASSYLVVIDNLEAIQEAENLPAEVWELANPSKFLLTSRHRVGPCTAGWVTISSLSVEHLFEMDALLLLRYEAILRGLHTVAQAPDETLRPILAATGGHPLGIKLIVGQLVGLSLRRVLAGLESVAGEHDPFYDYLYRPTWSLLSAAARQLLFVVALLPPAGAGWDDLSALTQVSDLELVAAVDELVTRSLLQAGGLEEKTYTIHPLTRRFVVQQLTRLGVFQELALQIGNHYLAYGRLHMGDWAALVSRQDHFLQAMEHCGRAGPAGQRIVVDGALLLGEFMHRRGSLALWRPYLDMALQAAEALADEAAQANLWNQQGSLSGGEGDQDAVLARHRRAAEIFDRIGDQLNRARTLRLIGNVYYTRAERAPALAFYEQARELLAHAPDARPRDLSKVLNNIACVHVQAQDWARALPFYEQAAALLDPDRDRLQLTLQLSNVGLLRWQMGCWRQALDDLLRVLPLQEASSDLVGQATTHQYLCLAYASLHDCDSALHHGRRALTMRLMLGSDNSLAHLYTDLAIAYIELDQDDAAHSSLSMAEPLWRKQGYADGLGRIRLLQGDLFRRAGDWPQAEAAYRDSLLLLEPRTDLQPQRVLALLGLAAAHDNCGNWPAARALLPQVQALAAQLNRPDLQVLALWLQAELEPAGARPSLEAALALCQAAGTDNDRLGRLGGETASRLAALPN